MTGTVYHVAPIPPDEEHTSYVEAGTLRIGVEYRLLDDAELAAHYTGDEMKAIQVATQGVPVQDNGVSIHIFGSDDGHEYLRFDIFEREPHYHYIEPSGDKQTIVDYDRVAMGAMLTWTLNQLATRLPEMLCFAGGATLAATLDTRAISDSLNKVSTLALEAEAALRSQHK